MLLLSPEQTSLINNRESVSCSIMSDSATPWTVAHWAPLSMEFSRQEYWNGLPCPSPGDLPDLGAVRVMRHIQVEICNQKLDILVYNLG